MRNFVHKLVALGAAGTLVVTLAACSDDSASEATTATTSTAVTTEAASTSLAAADSSEASSEECRKDPTAEEIQHALNVVNEEFASNQGAWAYNGDSNFDPCGTVTYALFEQGQAQTKVAFFHLGDYVGVDSTEPKEATGVEADPDGYGVSITYADGTAVYVNWEEQDNELNIQAPAPGQ